MQKKMNNFILRDTYFSSNPNGHGGDRRTSQIAELVSLAGYEVSDIDKDIATNKWTRFLNGIRFVAQHKFKVEPFYRFGACGFPYQIYRNAFTNHSGVKLLLWEATRELFLIAPYVARKAKFKVIAVPHNLESLVVGQIDHFVGRGFPESFENEMKHLSQADAVFCISREEQWLLNLRGLNADFLPYYPPKPILANLLNLREARKSSLNQRFLILGTAMNQPTLVGLIEQIQWLNQIRKEINFEVDIAGYGTEQLKDYCNNPSFTLHGTVDSQQLNDLLINAKAVLVHQKAGVGALTRIAEMLSAGIPVIANSNASRSAFGYPGVYCYDNKNELVELMSKQLDLPAMLKPPSAAQKRFVDCLKNLAQ